MLTFCPDTFTTRYDLPGWSWYTIIYEIEYHALFRFPGERTFFQKRPQVFCGGLELLLRQSDHERFCELEKAAAFAAVKVRDPGTGLRRL